MVVAEFEAFFSRPVAPTRRIALGRFTLPDRGVGNAATAAASMLLGGVLADSAGNLDDDELSGTVQSQDVEPLPGKFAGTR